MSMLDNLNNIKEKGIEDFLKKENNKWECPTCKELICCHFGICLNCNIDKLKKQ